jgi:hypothetical protein
MHEIGHVMTHNKRNGRLLREAAAWKWALANLKFEVSVEAWRAAFGSLDAYLSQTAHAKFLGFTAQEGPRGEFRIPAKSHWFWDVYNELDSRRSL